MSCSFYINVYILVPVASNADFYATHLNLKSQYTLGFESQEWMSSGFMEHSV